MTAPENESGNAPVQAIEGEPTVTMVTVQAVSITGKCFDYYSCEEAIKRLNDYLDHELDAEERSDVLKHLKICTPCLERFDFEQSLLVQLRERVRRVTAPGGLRDRVCSIFKNQSAQQSNPHE